VRNGRPLQRHTNQVLLGGLDTFLDGGGHFLCLPYAEPDDSMAVADDNQRTEAQVLAALHDLRHAVDRNHGVFDVELRWINAFADSHLKLQTGLSGGVGHGANPAVIEKAATVEDDSHDSFTDGSLGDGLPDHIGSFSIATSDVLREPTLERRLDARRGRKRLTVEIVDHLCVDV
jgi:hypothetical protein